MRTPVSYLRRRLACAIERAFREQHNLDVVIDPTAFVVAQGYYRSSPTADVYRWYVSGTFRGGTVGPTIYSYDTMTVCARGVILGRDSRHHLNYDASAQS